jgi:hypothetical protein
MMRTMNRGDELMEFLARYARKVHSDRFIKSVLMKEPGTSFLDIICASDVAYVICLLANSHEIWIDALKNKNKEGKKEKMKPRFTAGEGKKRVFGECMWNEDGKNAYVFALRNWQKAFNPKDPEYKMLRDGWEQWVSTKAQTMVLGTWTKKTITSVLATRTEEEVSNNAKSNNSYEEEEAGGVGADDGIEYDTDSDTRPMYNSGKWKSSSGTNNGAATNDDDDIDDADAEAGVVPSVAASGKNKSNELFASSSEDESEDEDDKEDGNDDKSKDDDGGMDDIIHSLDGAVGKRTTTTKRTKAGTKTKTAAMARAATARAAPVAEITSRKRNATGSSGADEQVRKGLRQRKERTRED